MKLATVKKSIVPPTPVNLAGFSFRTQAYTAIASDIHLRVFAFNKNLILVIADVIWWDKKMIEKIRDKCKNKIHIHPKNIVFHATHNHSGPQTSDRFSLALGVYDHSFGLFLIEKTYIAIRKAYEKKAETVTMYRHHGTSAWSIYRRKTIDGKTVMAPDETANIDRGIHTLTFKNSKNHIVALLTHWACHPTVSGDNILNGEYPNVCCEILENKFQNSVCGFLQGCAGDIRPNLTRNGNFYRGSFKEIQELGSDLANEVLASLEKKSKKHIPDNIGTTHQTTIPLSFNYSHKEMLKHDKDILKGSVPSNSVRQEWKKRHDKHKKDISLEVTVLELGQVTLLFFGAEMVNSYSQKLQRIFGDRLLCIGYTNGMIGYVPNKQQLKEGGYEAYESNFYFLLPAPFEITIEETILKHCINTLENRF